MKRKLSKIERMMRVALLVLPTVVVIASAAPRFERSLVDG